MEYLEAPIASLDSKTYVIDWACLSHRFSSVTVERIISERSQIPSINRFPTLDGLKDGSLVRFRCMIQDTLDRVMKHKKLGEFDLMYRSGFEGIPTSDCLSFSQDYYNVDRYTVVSIPGEAVEPAYSQAEVSRYFEAGVSEKRERPTIRDTEMATIPEEVSEPKRSRESFDMDEEPPAMVPAQESDEKDAADTAAPTAIYAHPATVEFMPQPTTLRVSAIANVCEPVAEFRLHDVVEITGIVSNFTPCESEYSTLPVVDLNIQVLHIEKVQPPTPTELSADQVSVARSAAKSILKKLLLGDESAAEYLLLQLISARVPGNDALPSMGSWGLNLVNADKVDASLLSKFVAQVLPDPCLSVPTSNEILLKQKFYPHRPVEQDFTSPGLLQLAPGSTVVLDERPLGEGNVNALNVLAITKAVREQELIGVFGSSEFINFKTDLRFIILNSGNNSSIFGNPNPSCGINGSVPFVTVPVTAAVSGSPLTEADISLSPQDLQLLKDYVSYAQALIPKVEISEAVVNKFQADWVECRKQEANVATEDIHAWATLLRAMPASLGLQETTIESWDMVLDLERTRRARVNPNTSTIERVDVASPVTVTGS